MMAEENSQQTGGNANAGANSGGNAGAGANSNPNAGASTTVTQNPVLNYLGKVSSWDIRLNPAMKELLALCLPGMGQVSQQEAKNLSATQVLRELRKAIEDGSLENDQSFLSRLHESLTAGDARFDSLNPDFLAAISETPGFVPSSDFGKVMQRRVATINTRENFSVSVAYNFHDYERIIDKLFPNGSAERDKAMNDLKAKTGEFVEAFPNLLSSKEKFMEFLTTKYAGKFGGKGNDRKIIDCIKYNFKNAMGAEIDEKGQNAFLSLMDESVNSKQVRDNPGAQAALYAEQWNALIMTGAQMYFPGQENEQLRDQIYSQKNTFTPEAIQKQVGKDSKGLTFIKAFVGSTIKSAVMGGAMMTITTAATVAVPPIGGLVANALISGVMIGVPLIRGIAKGIERSRRDKDYHFGLKEIGTMAAQQVLTVLPYTAASAFGLPPVGTKLLAGGLGLATTFIQRITQRVHMEKTAGKLKKGAVLQIVKDVVTDPETLGQAAGRVVGGIGAVEIGQNFGNPLGTVIGNEIREHTGDVGETVGGVIQEGISFFDKFLGKVDDVLGKAGIKTNFGEKLDGLIAQEKSALPPLTDEQKAMAVKMNALLNPEESKYPYEVQEYLATHPGSMVDPETGFVMDDLDGLSPTPKQPVTFLDAQGNTVTLSDYRPEVREILNSNPGTYVDENGMIRVDDGLSPTPQSADKLFTDANGNTIGLNPDAGTSPMDRLIADNEKMGLHLNSDKWLVNEHDVPVNVTVNPETGEYEITTASAGGKPIHAGVVTEQNAETGKWELNRDNTEGVNFGTERELALRGDIETGARQMSAAEHKEFLEAEFKAGTVEKDAKGNLVDAATGQPLKFGGKLVSGESLEQGRETQSADTGTRNGADGTGGESTGGAGSQTSEMGDEKPEVTVPPAVPPVVTNSEIVTDPEIERIEETVFKEALSKMPEEVQQRVLSVPEEQRGIALTSEMTLEQKQAVMERMVAEYETSQIERMYDETPPAQAETTETSGGTQSLGEESGTPAVETETPPPAAPAAERPPVEMEQADAERFVRAMENPNLTSEKLEAMYSRDGNVTPAEQKLIDAKRLYEQAAPDQREGLLQPYKDIIENTRETSAPTETQGGAARTEEQGGGTRGLTQQAETQTQDEAARTETQGGTRSLTQQNETPAASAQTVADDIDVSKLERPLGQEFDISETIENLKANEAALTAAGQEGIIRRLENAPYREQLDILKQSYIKNGNFEEALRLEEPIERYDTLAKLDPAAQTNVTEASLRDTPTRALAEEVENANKLVAQEEAAFREREGLPVRKTNGIGRTIYVSEEMSAEMDALKQEGNEAYAEALKAGNQVAAARIQTDYAKREAALFSEGWKEYVTTTQEDPRMREFETRRLFGDHNLTDEQLAEISNSAYSQTKGENGMLFREALVNEKLAFEKAVDAQTQEQGDEMQP